MYVVVTLDFAEGFRVESVRAPRLCWSCDRTAPVANPELSASTRKGPSSRGRARVGPVAAELRREMKASFSAEVQDQGEEPQSR